MAIIKYERGSDGVVRESKSNDGGKTYTSTGGNSGNGYKANNSGGGKVTSGNTGISKQGYRSDWNDYTGNTGKKYSVAGGNGTITVNRPDGTSATVRPTDANYSATLKAMQADGVNYTPNHTFTNQNGTYSTKDYTTGNKNLQYALEQAAKTNPGISVSDYAKSLYNRIGTTRGDGTTITLDDVNQELNRLGLSDYNSSNGIYTAGGNLLPGNSFVGQHTGSDGSNSANSLWYNYGGQDYLAGANGGDSSDWAQYVNGKTGNLDNLSYIFGNMANNQYAQQDSDFLNAYNQALQQFYANGGQNSENINNFNNYIGSLGNLNNATGGQSGYASDLWSQIQSLLQGGYDATNQFLASQQETAEKNAENLAREAWLNSQLQGDSLRESLSAAGLGTTGALQSAQLGVQSNFNNSLANINGNLNDMITSLAEQKLSALTDYNNNLANYAYQIQNDEADRAYQNAQLALQQQQAAYEREYQRQQLALQQAEYEYNKKLQQGSLYSDMYNNGSLSDAGLYNALNDLGLISNGYFANGSYTNGATTAQLQRQLAQAELENQLLANMKLRNSIKPSGSTVATSGNNPIKGSDNNSNNNNNNVINIARLRGTEKSSINPLVEMVNYILSGQ